MEDVLDVYHRPYDAQYPVVCLDEASKQLITSPRPDLPPKSGRVRRKDSEYKRNGTANLFMMFEPLQAKRHVRVTDHRKRVDFAHAVRELVDVQYPEAEKIVLVMDNLNTHNTAPCTRRLNRLRPDGWQRNWTFIIHPNMEAG